MTDITTIEATQIETPSERLSLSEVREAVQRLTAGEKTAVIKLAKIYRRKTRRNHDELLQEAMLRALSGQRTWKRSMQAVPFFGGVMRSIAWEWRSDQLGTTSQIDLVAGEDNPEGKIVFGESIETILSAFDDDPVAKEIVVEMMKETPAQEMKHFFMQKFGLSETEYESKRTKIRRRLEIIRREFDLE